MKNDDTQLIQRVLEGDDTAFSTLVKKYQKSVQRAGVAKGRRFPYRRGHHTGDVLESVSETLNAEEATAFRKLALCDSSEPLQHVAP